MNSLGARLTLWYVALVAATLAVVLLFGNALLRMELTRSIDVLNAAQFQEIRNRVDSDQLAKPEGDFLARREIPPAKSPSRGTMTRKGAPAIPSVARLPGRAPLKPLARSAEIFALSSIPVFKPTRPISIRYRPSTPKAMWQLPQRFSRAHFPSSNPAA